MVDKLSGNDSNLMNLVHKISIGLIHVKTLVLLLHIYHLFRLQYLKLGPGYEAGGICVWALLLTIGSIKLVKLRESTNLNHSLINLNGSLDEVDQSAASCISFTGSPRGLWSSTYRAEALF
jgi:hypothetical protein